MQPALQFMHLFPYIDSLWFGEGYDYNEEPDYWLVEVSGIPFGLMGDMMREGNLWRGMLYGMTTRFRCADPSALWRLWDSFGIANATMAGYWEARPPVSSDHADVRVTTYARHGLAALVAVASWHPLPLSVALAFDWAALGLDGSHVRLTLPDVGHGQALARPQLTDGGATARLDIAEGHGALLLVELGSTSQQRAQPTHRGRAFISRALMSRTPPHLPAAEPPQPRPRLGSGVV